jgi:hypothetical protein
MQNLIDTKLLMKVFSKAEQQGVAVDTAFGRGYELDGMTVASGYDGYDLYFMAHGVTVTLGFHQKYFIEAKDEQQIEQFIQLLKRLGNI